MTSADDPGPRVRLCGSVPAGGDRVLSADLGVLLRTHAYVVVDLDQLDGADPGTVSGVVLVLGDAVEAAGGWPAVTLVVSCPEAGLRAALRAMPALANVVVTGSVRQARRCCGDRPDRLSAEWRFPDEPSVLATARSAVAARLAAWWGAPSDDDVADVVLVVNELLTNAMEHGRSHALLRMTLERDTLEMTVRDHSADPPLRRPFSPTASRGRGLQMVEALVDDWGWLPHDDGKVVWARVTRPGR